MEITIKRTCNTYKSGCFGVLHIGNEPICVTLEESWLNNISNESCIPEGSYKVVKHNGHKYKDVWRIVGVNERSAILIHWGNTELDTAGCILVGKYFANFGERRGVANSRATLAMLKDMLPDEFMLTIKNCF